MVKYEKSLAEALANDNRYVDQYGIRILVKNIPDEERPGRLDPREYEIVKARAESSARSGGGGEKPMSIRDIRSSMGFPNLNMNTIELHTIYEEHDFGGNKVKLWIYHPRKPEGKRDRPGFIYLHGGGWIGGSPFAVENPCRLLSERADCVVFNVDYSLAPEKPYPNAFNDCFHALEHIYANADKYGVDRDRIGIGGDSAGGNLAAACAMRDRDLGTGMLKYQALIYPVVTLVNDGIPDYQWKLEDYTISREQEAFIEPLLGMGRPGNNGIGEVMAGTYIRYDLDLVKDPAISPLAMESHKGLCKAFIATAEFDGLRIQGEIYGKKLLEAGVDARIVRYKGVGHAFIDKLGYLPQAEDLIQEIANDVIMM